MKSEETEKPEKKEKKKNYVGRKFIGPRNKVGAPFGHPPYPGCENGGRPAIYTKEYVDELAEDFLEFIELPSSIYFKEFAIWIRQKRNLFFNNRHFTDFAEKSERFKEIYEYAKVVQESKLAKGALIRKLDPQMAKFLLSAAHGMSDKQSIEHTGNDVINVIHYGKKAPKTWKDEQKKEKSNELQQSNDNATE